MKKLLSLLAFGVLGTSIAPETLNINKLNDSDHPLSQSKLKNNSDEFVFYNKDINAQQGIIVSKTGKIYATSRYVVWSSNNGGNSWEKIYTAPNPNYVNDMFASDDGTLYLATGMGGLLKTTDDQNFIKVDNIEGPVYKVAISTDGSIFALASGNYIWKSDTNGIFSKTEIVGQLQGTDTHFINFNGFLYIQVSSGIWKYNNNQNLEKVVSSKDINQKDYDINNFCIDKNGTFLVLTGHQANELFQGKNNDFTKIEGISHTKSIIYNIESNEVYLGGNNGIWKYFNGKVEFVKKIDNSYQLAIYKNNLFAGGPGFVATMTNVLDWTTSNSEFTLVDTSKELYWLSNENLVSSGKVNGHIANDNINFVQLNGATLPQTNKVWDFQMGQDDKNIDYRINVNFTIDNEIYNSEMIVSVLMDSANISIVTNQGGIVDEYPTVVPGSDKVNGTSLSSRAFYSKTEIKASLIKPTSASSITGIITGLNSNWEKNGQSQSINENDIISIDGSQFNAYNGLYIIDTTDSAGNKASYYLVVSNDETQEPVNFWDSQDGQYFFEYAKINSFDGIKLKNLSSKEINNLINQSLEWENKLATNDQLLESLIWELENSINIGTSEFINKADLLSQIKDLIPKKIEISGYFTNLYDQSKVEIHINDSSDVFKPGENVTVTLTYNGAVSDSFEFTINKTTEPLSNGFLAGIVAAVTVVLILLGFVFWKWAYKPIRRKINKSKAKEFQKKELQASEE